jgi:hypothetical protein
MNFDEKDFPVINLVLEFEGAIFGGYIRDTILGVKATDIDILIPEKKKMLFGYKLNGLDYHISEKQPDWTRYGKDGCEYIKKNYLPLHIVWGMKVKLRYPDFDVNMLSYGINGLTNWLNDSNDVDEIIDHIRNKEAYLITRIFYNEERIRKMESKGFTIVW